MYSCLSKLRVWGVQKCKPSVCAKSAQTGTDPPSNRFPVPAHMAVNCNSRKLTAEPSSEQWLHQCKQHTYKKLRVWRVQKCKPWVCAKSAQTCMDPPNNRFPAMAHKAVNGNSRKLTAKPSTEQWLHQCMEHTYKKLRVWGVQKCKHWVCANSAQTATHPSSNRFPAMAHKAVNGNSLKLTAKPSSEQWLH